MCKHFLPIDKNGRDDKNRYRLTHLVSSLPLRFVGRLRWLTPILPSPGPCLPQGSKQTAGVSWIPGPQEHDLSFQLSLLPSSQVSGALPLHALPERQFCPINRIETSSVCSTMWGARNSKTWPLYSKDGWMFLRLLRKQLGSLLKIGL